METSLTLGNHNLHNVIILIKMCPSTCEENMFVIELFWDEHCAFGPNNCVGQTNSLWTQFESKFF